MVERRGSKEMLVRTPIEQRSSSSGGPAGWSDGRRGRQPADARKDRMDSEPARGSSSKDPTMPMTCSDNSGCSKRGGKKEKKGRILVWTTKILIRDSIKS
ncbi:hypothetical protein Syun_000963 [Stephania yunnanensis]|uniref:Uncharacterized protein n=1 Tax=Stephania yunnanensis TaxID=152371 RepID=A0AAP0LCW5_9MAGN